MTISIVLYGRNDNYGYNLHKRAALSLNCMAEVLTDPSDEILFVDYNTPDDFPTFPEAIQDTLTQRARDILRIFRVRPRIHQRFKSKTHLVALEPIARNVAIRRSCSANRWILSTNTDMIFVPRSVNSLSKIAQGLAPGFYHAPRIELPEVLWESLDRHAPADIITTVRGWGSTLHLNEIILGAEFIIYDGPGDFQLLLRDDLFNNHGFHEEMLLGWHVDSNIAMRMYIKYGKVGDLGTEVYGYHCDHTRQVTPAHGHARLENDWRRYCTEVDRPDVPDQAATWGCASDTIEELRLVANPASAYVQTLREAVGAPLTEPQVSKYTPLTYNRTDYDPRHMVPFLADMFVSMPKNSNLMWYGAGVEMLSRFATVWDRLDFTGKIMVDPELVRKNDLAEEIEFYSTSGRLDRADAFIFDFGGLPGRSKQLSGELVRRFVEVVREERRRLSAGMSPRRVIALNSINNQFHCLVDSYTSAAATPCGTHMRHGFVLPARSKDDWLPFLHVGRAGVRVGDRIDSDPRRLGVIAYGPYKYLDSGCYRLSIKVALAPEEGESGGNEPCIVIEVHAGAEVFGVYLLSRSALAKPDHEFFFAVPGTADDVVGYIETRVTSFGRIALSIQAVNVESIPASSNRIGSSAALFSPPLALKIENWLPYLSIGPLGRADAAGIIAQKGSSDFVVFGPYWALPVGYYELVIHIEREKGSQSLNHLIQADVMVGDQQLVAANFHLDAQCAGTTISLPFEMRGNSSNWRQIETRIWSSGEERFLIRAVSINPLEQSGRQELLKYLLLGEAGRRVSFRIRNVEGRIGTIAYSPNIRLSPGPHRMIFATEVTPIDHELKGSQACAIALVKQVAEILEVTEISLTAGEVKEQQLLFEVPSDPDHIYGVEFFFQAIRAADINFHALKVEPIEKTPEPIEKTPQRRCPAVLSLPDWLPFLRNGKSAHGGEGGIVVSEGVEEFAVYGPNWTLPAGCYEMRALVVPSPQGADHRAVVTAQVTAESGARTLVESRWQLSQYKLIDTTPAVEFRLPFSLSGDLAPAARTIETRIFTRGDASFRILSLAVTAKGDEPEGNWFPYLVVGECGVHTGLEIKVLGDKIGYIACTPPMRVIPGHYRVSPDMQVEAGVRSEDMAAVEVWSGSDLIAVEVVNSGRDKRLEFDVANEFSGNDVELRIRALAPTGLSIRGLSVEKISDAIEPGRQKLLKYLLLGEAGQRVSFGIKNVEGRIGTIACSPNIRLSLGPHRMIFATEVTPIDHELKGSQACAIALVKHVAEILEVTEISSAAGEVKEQQVTGFEIKVLGDKIGYIACTPPMRVIPGHYRVSPDMQVEARVRSEDIAAVEVWSGSDLIAVEVVNSGRDKRLEFDVANEFSGNGIELRIRALTPTGFSMRGLSVEKISDAIEPGALPAALRLNNWLPFLEVGAAARRVGRSVLARYAQSGYVVHGPYWPLPAGEYVMMFTVELEGIKKAVPGTWLRPKSAIKTLLLFAKVLHDGDADVMLDGRRIAVAEGFTVGSFFSSSTSVWLPFKIEVDDVKSGSRLETRVWSAGRRCFRIRSLTVRRRMPNERIYKPKNWPVFRLTQTKLVHRIRRLAR